MKNNDQREAGSLYIDIVRLTVNKCISTKSKEINSSEVFI